VWATCHGGHVARVSPEPRVFANNELQTRPNYDQNTITWEIQLMQCQRSSPKLCFKVALKWVSKDQTNLYDLLLHLTYGYRGVKDKTCFYICRIWMTLKSALIPSWGMTITRTWIFSSRVILLRVCVCKKKQRKKKTKREWLFIVSLLWTPTQLVVPKRKGHFRNLKVGE
jgi:hypothetical protein